MAALCNICKRVLENTTQRRLEKHMEQVCTESNTVDAEAINR
ncbi:unnamed protein product [Tenebrio molitor]|nr:unnamed protein product [Tenebrio molitor]